jgi:hypothetical protein
LSCFDERTRDGGDLRCSLRFTEDHLGHALTQRAMVVDMGETQVFEGQVPQTGQRRVHVRGSIAELLE